MFNFFIRGYHYFCFTGVEYKHLQSDLISAFNDGSLTATAESLFTKYDTWQCKYDNDRGMYAARYAVSAAPPGQDEV